VAKRRLQSEEHDGKRLQSDEYDEVSGLQV
jgi:hypothetical protein